MQPQNTDALTTPRPTDDPAAGVLRFAHRDHFRLMVEQFPAVMWSMDRDLRFTSSSGAGLAGMGLKPGQVLGLSIYDFFQTQDDQHPSIVSHRRSLNGESVATETVVGDRLFEVHLEPLREADGRIIGVLGVAWDITSLTRANHAIEAANQLLTTTLEALADAVLTLDHEGRVRQLNQAARALFPKLAIGHLLAEHLHLRDAPPGPAPGSPGWLQTLPANEESLMWLAGEVNRALQVQVRPLPAAAGLKLGQVLVLRDVTRQLHLEAESQRAQKLDALGGLAGGIAHEFNNLLMAVMANVSMVRQQLPREGIAAECLLDAEKACLRARGLTQRLVTFARGGAPIRVPISLQPLLRETSRFFIRNTNLRLHCGVPADLWEVAADEGQLTQVLANLIRNAHEASPAGGQLRLSASNEPAGSDLGLPGPAVRIVLDDAGEGLAPAAREHLFEPFFSTRPGHTGLGLAASRSIILQHDGSLTFAASPMGGTRATILLPALVESPPTQAAPVATSRPAAPAAPPGAKGSAKRGRVLVMDDEPDICRIMELLLGRSGCQVTTAANGDQALALWQAARAQGQTFDLVLTDLTIPKGMGGLELVRALKRLDPAARVAAVSGYGNDPVMANYREHGFVATIGKPYTYEQLLALLDQLLPLKN